MIEQSTKQGRNTVRKWKQLSLGPGGYFVELKIAPISGRESLEDLASFGRIVPDLLSVRSHRYEVPLRENHFDYA